jgi:type I restriction enzyme S subunit
MMPFVKLKDIVQVNTGTKNPSKTPDAPFQYVDVAAVDNIKKTITGARELMGSEAPSRARKVICADDILVSTVRPNLNAVAKVPTELDGQIASTGFCILRATKALPEYLFFFVRSEAFVQKISNIVAGAMYPAVTDKQVLDQIIPLPPLDEQRRIVNTLSHAESIVRLRREAQKKSADIIPALFLEMFGDPATNPKGWPVLSIGEVIASADYGSSTKASENGSGLPIIRMGNVDYAGRLKLENLKYVELSQKDNKRFGLLEGDILFNRTNSKDLVGKTGLWDGSFDAVAASYFIRLRVARDIINPLFFWAFMNSGHMKRVLFDTSRGAIGQANINSRELRSFRIIVPPVQTQNMYESHCRDIFSIQAQQAAATQKAEDTFAALLAKTFTDNGEHYAA